MPVADGTFDATVAGLVVNFIPNQARAVIEMKRVTRPGGVVAAYVWDYAGEMQMRRFWDAAADVDAQVGGARPAAETSHGRSLEPGRSSQRCYDERAERSS